MLEEQGDSPAEEQDDLAALGTESCTAQQSLEGEAEDQEKPDTAEHDGLMVDCTDEENNNCNGVSSSCPASSAIVDPIQIKQ